MKKSLIFIGLLFALFSTPSLALQVTNVGGFDAFYNYKNVNQSGPEAKAWLLEAYQTLYPSYGYTADNFSYMEINGNIGWATTTDDSSALYLDFLPFVINPDYYPDFYLVKSGSTNAFTFDVLGDGFGGSDDVIASTIMFKNLADTQYGLIDLDWFKKTNGVFDITTISHTSFAIVPEASTFILFGVGLAGIAFIARRRREE